MNARSAKKLRAAIGFVPSAERRYKMNEGTLRRSSHGFIAGTIVATGTRRQYQAVKRAGIVKHVTGAR